MINKEIVRKVINARQKVINEAYEYGISPCDLTEEEFLLSVYEKVNHIKGE